MAAEAQNNHCQGCMQESPISVGQKPLLNGHTCCPRDCEVCKRKNCYTKKEKCQCNICTCGCQDKGNENKACKDSSCVGCKVICSKLPDGDRCRCTFCDCGCEDAFKEGKLCYDSTNQKCKECKGKCEKSKDGTCICKLCNCGCNGVNCQCCRRCNPETKCQGEGKCDRKEIHGDKCPITLCKNKAGSCSTIQCQCKDMGISLEQKDACECKCRCEQQCPRILCDKKRSDGSNGQRGICNGSTNGACTCKCTCNCNAYGKYYGEDGKKIDICTFTPIHFYAIGKCRFACTNCGRLCDQDRCMNWIRVIVIGLIILASLFVLRAIFPEKFRAIMSKIRATFASSPVHSGRSLNNLVGHRIPEEVNIDRYPAFRPRTYAGLS